MDNGRNKRAIMADEIWSPDVVFFRDDTGALLSVPAKASVLTLPAVNMGQVRFKGEDERQAEEVMHRRMKIALAIFTDKGATVLFWALMVAAFSAVIPIK